MKNNKHRTKNKIKGEEGDYEEIGQEVYITHIEMAKLCGFSVSTLYRRLEEQNIENDGKLISPEKRDAILIKLGIKKPEK